MKKSLNKERKLYKCVILTRKEYQSYNGGDGSLLALRLRSYRVAISTVVIEICDSIGKDVHGQKN